MLHDELNALENWRDVHDYEPAQMAVIDVGSNSFRLIVMQYIPGVSYHLTDEIREVVRLSEGLSEGGFLRAAAVERALETMKIYAAFCRASNITDIRACATAAVRTATNSKTFLSRVFAETGIQVRVLSDYEEAFYGYLAAINTTTLSNGYILDLGGASLEITRVENRQMCESVSLPLGALLATETYLLTDPVQPKDVKNLRRVVQKHVEELAWFRAKPELELVGQGGTFRNLAHLVQRRCEYPLDELHGYEMTLAGLAEVNEMLLPMSLERRKQVPGMKEDRADIILAGGIVIQTVMENAGFAALTMCQQGLREGIFYEAFLGLGKKEGDASLLIKDVRRDSILNLAHIYHYQKAHAEHVAFLSLSLFDQIPPDTMLCGAAERELLWAASILHDIGVIVDYNDHHKHSHYLILNGGLPGFTHREIVFIATLARFHRKGEPAFNGVEALMEPEDKLKLLQMVACLRFAEQLDRSRDGSVREIVLHCSERFAQLEVKVAGDGVVALWSVQRHTDIFEQAFQRKLELVIHPIG